MAATNYSNLSPQDALAAWYANKAAVLKSFGLDPSLEKSNPQQLEAQIEALGPAAKQAIGAAADMTQLSQQNPAAFKLVATGTAPTGDTRKIFNPATGGWDDQEVKGAFSHPETWLQLGLGAAVAAPVVIGALGASGAAAGAGAGGAAPAAGSGAGAATAATGAASGLSKAFGSSWLGPLLGTGTQLVGQYMGTKAAENAADQNRQAAEEALAFEKQKYADEVANRAPFLSNATAASDRMAQLLGLPARSGSSSTAPPTYGPKVGAYAGPAPGVAPAPSMTSVSGQPQATTQQQPSTVTLLSPDRKETRAVPADQAQKYIQAGAIPLNPYGSMAYANG